MSFRDIAPVSEPSVALTFLNDFQARTVEAIAERVIPGDGADAGATEAGVVYYIDRALSGFSANLQRVYRLGLCELDMFCQSLHGAPFIDLTTGEQDAILRQFLGSESGPPAIQPQPGLVDQGESGAHPAAPNLSLLFRLFAVIREHAIEGYFCDPVYGGNRNAVGWRLVGFPGAQWEYTEEQMKAGYDLGRIGIKTLSDLRRELSQGGEHVNGTRREGAADGEKD